MQNLRGSAVAGHDDEGGRLDTFVSEKTGLSRNRVQKLIFEGQVLVDGKAARKNHPLAPGESISWRAPLAVDDEVVPQAIPLEVVFEDDQLVVVDKPANMVMYPGPGHSSETLLNALLSRYPDISGVGGRGRSGIFRAGVPGNGRKDEKKAGGAHLSGPGNRFDPH
jgi:23S rRNA pseudouridine1911/1915/1917 synthase